MSNSNLSEIDIQKSNISLIEHHNIHVDYAKIKFIKIFEILIGVFLINLTFATLAYIFLYNEISNATTYIDFFYFSVVSLSTAGYGDMAAITPRAKLSVSLYLLLVFSFILSFAL